MEARDTFVSTLEILHNQDGGIMISIGLFHV